MAMRTYFLFLFVFIVWLCGSNQEVYAASYSVKPGMSIQHVINQAENGATIFVQKGIYQEHLYITKPVSLVGEKGTIIDGNMKGSIITVKSSGVTIRNMELRYSGSQEEDAAIQFINSYQSVIEQNIIHHVKNGIKISHGSNHIVRYNQVSSSPVSLAKRGNGIDLENTNNIVVEHNQITGVQDGVYTERVSHIRIRNNTITRSRYAVHFMFSNIGNIDQNSLQNNITGLMIMDSKNLQIRQNIVTNHLDYRGYGAFLYESAHVVLEDNQWVRNHTGIAFEQADYITARNNIIANNYIGLEVNADNRHSVFYSNDLIGNLLQIDANQGSLSLNNSKTGNYWDDYNSFDLNGDGIGETPYQSNRIYKNSYWSFFFESPAIKLWNTVGITAPLQTSTVDPFPFVQPLHSTTQMNKTDHPIGLWGVVSVALTAISVYVIYRGRRISQ
jgi:nitrous oxidase accessory protein